MTCEKKEKTKLRRLYDDYRLYCTHLLIAVIPYRLPPYGNYYGDNKPGEPGQWDKESLDIFIEEARDQYERQQFALMRIESLSQFLFATGVGILALVIGFYNDIGGNWVIAWWIAFALHILGMMGAGANLRNKKIYGTVDVIMMSKDMFPSNRVKLAKLYINAIPRGEDTNTTLLGHYWIALRLMVSAGITFTIVWLVGRAADQHVDPSTEETLLSLMDIF